MLSLLPANVALAFRGGLHSPPCEARVAPSRYPAAPAAEQGCWLLLGATPSPSPLALSKHHYASLAVGPQLAFCDLVAWRIKQPYPTVRLRISKSASTRSRAVEDT